MRIRAKGLTREVMSEMVVGLAQHRTLSTRQLRDMYAPESSLRWTERLVASLEDLGLVARAEHRLPERWALWYLTEAGAEQLDPLVLDGVTTQLLTAKQADGPLQLHTLAVNDVALAFMRAARERAAAGDVCGPLAWQHEVWHYLEPPNGRSRGRGLRADAVLRYTTTQPRVRVRAAFIEVDRGSIEPQELAEQLGRYGRLFEATSCWRSQYSEFPRVLVVFASNARARRELMEDRMVAVAAMLRGNSELMAHAKAGNVRIYFTLLEHLHERGPFGRIWARLDAPERLVGWLDDERQGLHVVSPSRPDGA